MSEADYHLVPNDNGTCSVGCRRIGEVMHPRIGPAQEGGTLYVEGLDLRERARRAKEFCVWDVGMGAASNALVVMRALRDLPVRLHVWSFDVTADALRFAIRHAAEFDLLGDLLPMAAEVLDQGFAEFTGGRAHIRWEYCEGEFLEQSAGRPSPQAVCFDPWSPRKNPGMWTLAVFRHLYSCLDPELPCSLATYSRATCIRSALLLAGFHVGIGPGIGAKEESTIAATDPALLANPLPASWLQKAERSHSGRPLYSDRFTQAPVGGEMLEQLRRHPQFR